MQWEDIDNDSKSGYDWMAPYLRIMAEDWPTLNLI
jgi:hypothetical protein